MNKFHQEVEYKGYKIQYKGYKIQTRFDEERSAYHNQPIYSVVAINTQTGKHCLDSPEIRGTIIDPQSEKAFLIHFEHEVKTFKAMIDFEEMAQKAQ